MPLTPVQVVALRAACQAALPGDQINDVPLELTVPQWADESEWGIHQPGNNPFGIKALPGETYTRDITSESPTSAVKNVEQNFESFPSLAAAFSRHAELISTGEPYKAAFAQYEDDRDITALIQNIAPIYARANNYATIILEIGRMPQVVTAIAEARGT